MNLDPMDLPPATARAEALPSPEETEALTNRLLIAFGVVAALLMVLPSFTGAQVGLSATLLATPIVLGVVLGKRLTPRMLATGGMLALPLALGVLWML